MLKITNHLTFRIGLSALIAVAVCSSLHATPVTYTYTGQPFTFVGTGPVPAGITAISGSFALPAALPANFAFQAINPGSVSFTDGLEHLTLQDAFVSTNSTGTINTWDFDFLAACIPADGPNCLQVKVTVINRPQIATQDLDEGVDLTGNNFAWFTSSVAPGSWCASTSPCAGGGGGSPVPESSSLVLLGAGLLSIAGVVRRKLRFSSRRDL